MGLLIEKYIGKLGRKLFLIFCWLFTLIVIAALADIKDACQKAGWEKVKAMQNAEKRKCKIWWNYIVDVSFAVSMNLFLLLPTGLSILGNKKDTGDSTSLLKILGVNPTLDQAFGPYI